MSDTKDKCGSCYFWTAPECVGAFNGTCHRYPEERTKNISDFCGEFKDRKVIEILREVKKE